MIKYEIKTIQRNCEFKKGEKIKIEQWTNLKTDSIIFDSNLSDGIFIAFLI